MTEFVDKGLQNLVRDIVPSAPSASYYLAD